MADIIPFKKRSAKDRNQGQTLCRNGFHKWKIVQEKQFDVKQGRLVTLLKCTRCGKTKTQAS